MSDYQDALQFRKTHSGKWMKVELGYARPSRDGLGWDINFKAIPLPNPDGPDLCIRPRQDQRQDNRQQEQGPSAPAGGGMGGMEDSIPFGPEIR